MSITRIDILHNFCFFRLFSIRFGYDYGGYRVELPEGIDMNDGQSVQESVAFGNQMADWMNEDEED